MASFQVCERRVWSLLDAGAVQLVPEPVGTRDLHDEAVWSRDGGRCTFVSQSGKRCNARSFLEFDHIEPVARGGLSRLGNIRIRCRVHNQSAAELAYGSGFMHEKRQRSSTLAASPG